MTPDKSAPTPAHTPWFTSSTHHGQAMDIAAEDGANIAIVHGPEENGPDEFRAIAALIVKAANNHEDLVSVLREYVRLDDSRTGSSALSHPGTTKRGRAVLKAVS